MMQIEDIDLKIKNLMQEETLNIYSLYNPKDDLKNVVFNVSKVRNTLEFKIIGINNPFSSLKSDKSMLKVYFNFDGILISYGIYYYLHMHQNRFNTACNIYYDKNYLLNEIYYFRVDYSGKEQDLSYTVHKDNLIDFDDIETLVNFFFIRENNSMLEEILPEYYIDGVYDFNNIDFLKRLELAKIYFY